MLKTLIGRANLRRHNVAAYSRDQEAFNKLTPLEKRETLSQRLLETLKYFGNRPDGFPEWKSLAAFNSPQAVWKEWATLPIVTKRDLQERFAPEKIISDFGIQGVVNSTGGSSGVPTRFIWDEASRRRNATRSQYLRLKLGWRPGLPILCLWGSPRDMGRAESPRTRIGFKLSGFEMINGYEFTEQTIIEIKESLDRHSTLAVYGYTSLLERASRELISRGIITPPGKIVTAWSAAEQLHLYQDELFAQAFGIGLHDQYGGREMSALGYRLRHESSFHLLRPDFFIEIVNENNEWCQPGETGRILLTTLTGRGTPFVRYENGDLGTFGTNDIDESGITGLTSIEGRISNIITLPNGKGLHSIFWGQTFSMFDEIHEYHVHQQSDGSIEIKYIGKPLSHAHHENLTALLRRRLEGAPFVIERTSTLPKTPQGKYLRITSDFDK